MQLLDVAGLTFDDVLLVPRCSGFTSRFNGDIDLSTKITRTIQLKYPILSANMDTVTERTMAAAMRDLGCLGIIHRFMNVYAQIDQLEGLRPCIACIGVGHSSRERLEILTHDLNLDTVLIDIAHGHCTAMIEQIKWVKSTYPSMDVIAGNIATYEAAIDLINAGADALKVGVGPGSLCTTRIRTGIGIPQLTAIDECSRATYEVNQPVFLIADGGIRNSGDIVKALAAGADAVMLGNLFAGTDETPGEVFTRGNPPIKFKTYRGMASRKAQESWKGYATSIEGEMIDVPYKGPIKGVFEDLIAGILSGMSYQGAHDLAELRRNHHFIRQTVNGYRESTPHGL